MFFRKAIDHPIALYPSGGSTHDQRRGSKEFLGDYNTVLTVTARAVSLAAAWPRFTSFLWSTTPEDRLAWDLEEVSGATMRLWLTQRLCRRLVEALIKMIPAAAPPEAPPQRQAAAQSWEQAAAMARFGKVPGVKPQPRALAGLVRSVQIRPLGERLDLTLQFGESEERTLGVDPQALRQLLGVMRRLYTVAAWPMDIWPAWTAESSVPPAADAVN